MTLIEAIKSGKPFKRPRNSRFYADSKELYQDTQMMKEEYFIESVTANDWELVKEPCKHEPMTFGPSIFDRLGRQEIKAYGPFGLIDIPVIEAPSCKHCGVKIKSTGWTEA